MPKIFSTIKTAIINKALPMTTKTELLMENKNEPVYMPVLLILLVPLIIAYYNYFADIHQWTKNIDSKTLEFYKAIGTFLAALIAAAIASIIQWRQHKTAEKQWRTAQQKLNFELFDRRFAIYSAIYTLTEEIAMKGNILEAKAKYYNAIRPSVWLCSQELFDYLSGEYLKDAIEHTENLYGLKNDPRLKNDDIYKLKYDNYQQWLKLNYPKIKNEFDPYFSLDASKIII